ncbi:MAG: cation:proton antiporter [Armatimonadota bacterium]|nr:cation:proton antiporter [Armatimonadota bacterium]
MPETRFLADLGLLFLAALIGGGLAHLLRQPLIVGYIIGGILVGPFTPGPTISDPRSFQVFAEIGVVLLLFSVGVEFSIEELLRAGKVALYGGPVAIALIVLLTALGGRLLGWPLAQSLVVGGAVSTASTMVIFKFLLERGELNAPHGRLMVGITLMEDLAVVAMSILLPALGAAGEQRLPLFTRGLLEAALVLVPLLWLARRVVPRVLHRVALTRNMELFLLVALAIAVGTAALTLRLGLTLALGAFLAGLLISESEFSHEALARVLPMRDVFVAVFFVSLGMLVRPQSLVAEWPTVVVLILIVTLGKFGVWSSLVRLAGHRPATAIMTGVGLMQVGEIAYVLAGVGRLHGLITPSVHQAIIATSLVTILLNAQVFRRTPRWLQALLARRAPAGVAEAAGEPQEGHAIICGFGRVGRQVADALDTFGTRYTVIDLDPEATAAARMRGAVSVFGDAGNDLILDRAGAWRARLAVVAIPDFDAAHRCVRALRRMSEDLPILVRVHHVGHRARMLDAGATEVIQPEVEAGLTIVRHSLDRLGVDHAEGRRYLEGVRRHWSAASDEEASPVSEVR